MNIIRLNFIPAEMRREKNRWFSAGIAGIPPERIVGILLAAAVLLILFHIVLLAVMAVKYTENRILEARWSASSPEKQSVDLLSNETRELRSALDAFKPVLSQGNIHWPRLLADISASMPKGIWLTSMTYADGQLVIMGSSVSKTRNEMVSPGMLVSALKQKDSVQRFLAAIDVDSIQRREATALSIVDFTLKARQK
jgi:Tfp pilus assembly protein PilN